tara:strand:- start:26848 stop:27645 length:798 start_codon:yes stop_codon:yes gene_type:complete
MNLNMYQYEKTIEITCADGDNTSNMTTYLRNMPMYDGQHKLHKGIDNTLRFNLRDTDRKPIDLTNKTIIWKMYDRETRENVLFKYLTVTNATKGMAQLTIFTTDTIMLPQGFYQFAMYTVENGVEQIIYTDTYDNAKGVIEVIDDVYPEFVDSQESSTFFNDGSYFMSTAFDGSSSTSKSKSIHTVALYFDNFSGTVNLQGDLSEQPSSQHSDWFNINPKLFSNPDITVNNETGVQAFVLEANVNWIRVRYTATNGSIKKVLLRN